MRLRTLAISFVPIVLAACGADTTEPTVLLDCSTLATSIDASAATLTKTSSGLQYRDQVVGTGASYVAGQTVGVRYAGCLTNGSRFDSNEAPKSLLTFRLGSGLVIKGWDEGLVGMKIGGRRQLVIPASLGYGAQANGPIPANSVLVFTVDAVSVQ